VIAQHKIAFARIADAALRHVDIIVRRWLPDGRREGVEWTCRNPIRDDRRRGSFKVNTANGKWADFAVGACGNDLISLAAYLHHISQADAARKIADMIGISPYDES
jgi:hypothetical protein